MNILPGIPKRPSDEFADVPNFMHVSKISPPANALTAIKRLERLTVVTNAAA
jgi:hypothetical protein